MGYVAVMTLAILNSPALAQTCTTSWTDGTDDWFNCQLWSADCPTLSCDAYINQGKPQINSSDANARSLIVGQNGGDNGAVDVNGGTLVTAPQNLQEDPFPAAGAVYVGYQGRGTTSITNGGSVNSGNGYIGAFSGPLLSSNGAVTVSGSGSLWMISASGAAARLFIGGSNGGVGLLTIKDTGEVEINNGSFQIPVLVGPSGTLTGNGTIKIPAFSLSEQLSSGARSRRAGEHSRSMGFSN